MPENSLAGEPRAADGLPRWNVWTRTAAALLLLLPLLMILQPRTSLPEGRDVLVLVEIPSVADFLTDTAVVEHLVRSGASGVVVRPSTLGGLLHGPDVSMATGAEIIRLFRMESIANIWMWEQLKGRPIRPDAVYLFTNQLLFFESVLATLRASFGENAARPYSDGEHDFGGGIPGNFIIETFVSPEEIRSVSFGLERHLRERLAATGLMPVIELSGAEAADAPADAAFLVTTDIAAQAAWRSIPGERILLLEGVGNPGWRRVTPAHRVVTDSTVAPGAAIVTPLAEAFRLLGDLKARGVVFGGRDAPEAPAAAPSRFAERAGRALLGFFILVALLLTILKTGPLLAGGRLSDALAISRGTIGAGILFGGGASFLLLFTDWHAEHAAALLIVLFGFLAGCRWEKESPETRAWGFPLVIGALLLAGHLTAPGRTPPSPWALSLIVIALVAAVDAAGRRVNPVFLPIIALLASGFAPWEARAMAAIMLGAIILPRFVAGAEIRGAIRATIWPSGLAVLPLASVSLAERLLIGGLLAGAAIGLVAAERWTTWHADRDNSSSAPPKETL